MVITHKLKMNMEEGDIAQRLEMPMGDVSTRQIEMLLHLRQSPWVIPEGVTVLICYLKPDGTKGEYDTMPDGSAAWSVNDNVLTVFVAPQVLTAAGNATLYAEIYLEEKVLHTFAVEISIKAPFGKLRGKQTASEDYVYATNVLRGPVMAQPGQLLSVEAVDASGRVTKLDTMDVAELKTKKAVLYAQQTLTDAEKERARANIGAASQLKMDWVAGKFIDNALVLLDEKLGNGLLYVDSGKLKLTLQDGQEKTVTFLTNEDGVGGTVLYTAQALTDAQKLQARTNIGAAEKMQVEQNTARLLEGSLVLTDKKNNGNRTLFAENGKLLMENQAVPGQRVTFLTNEDEQRIMDSVLAALPIYGGEVETV